MHPLIERAFHADPAVAAEASATLFRDVVEPLSDSFEPADVDRYVELFAPAIARAVPDYDAPQLVARYQRIRRRRPIAGNPRRVFVLSRVTLGADIAVTSVVVDAAKKRFPSAEVCFVGPRKSCELFEADPRLSFVEAPYPRTGAVADRLAVRVTLRAVLDEPDSLVLDPDSRLTQLGLLPVCGEDRYHFFESRSAGADGEDSLGDLARRWCRDVLGVDNATGFIAPDPCEDGADIAVSLGVGENPRKRVADPFEEELLAYLGGLGASVLVDLGAGGEEADRVRRAIARCPGARTWEGSFAAFAARIARSRLYVGYDSAGQHAAAACGVPVVTVFAGHPSLRMLHRWRASGAGPSRVVPVDHPDPRRVLEEAVAAITALRALVSSAPWR